MIQDKRIEALHRLIEVSRQSISAQMKLAHASSDGTYNRKAAGWNLAILNRRRRLMAKAIADLRQQLPHPEDIPPGKWEK